MSLLNRTPEDLLVEGIPYGCLSYSEHEFSSLRVSIYLGVQCSGLWNIIRFRRKSADEFPFKTRRNPR